MFSETYRHHPELQALISLWSLIAIATAPGVVAAEDSLKLPNIVLILADDLGYGDVECYNPTSRIPTPNLNQLARDGMRFTDAHSPCTVCTPSRYSLMTGQMAFRVPNGGRVFTGAGGPSLISADRLTLPQMLRNHGYATACVGKWHIGMTFYDRDGKPIHNDTPEAVSQIDYSRRIAGGPLDCGFDEFFGTACCPTTDWLYAYIDGDRIPVPPTGLLDKTHLPKHPWANDNRRGWHASDFDLEEVDMKFLNKSQSFLRRHVKENPNQPFFLYHATQAVHLPSFPGRSYKGQSQSGPHGDFIVQFDDLVGQLLKTLDDLHVADNTLFIVTSDNGPEVTSVVHMRREYNHDGAFPWRGMKRDNWEGGHRVPFLVRWPGKIQPGSTSSQTISLCDVFLTMAELLDAQVPDNAAEDSFSLLPILTGSDQKPIRPYLLQQGFHGSRNLAIRRGNWKYLAHKGSGGNNYQSNPELQPFALTDTAPSSSGQLFDLDSDPGETINLALEHPDIVRELEDLLKHSITTGRTRAP